MTIREQLRHAYEHTGYSVKYISAVSGVSESTVRNALFSHRNVGVENVAAVAAALNLETLQVAGR